MARTSLLAKAPRLFLATVLGKPFCHSQDSILHSFFVCSHSLLRGFDAPGSGGEIKIPVFLL